MELKQSTWNMFLISEIKCEIFIRAYIYDTFFAKTVILLGELLRKLN